MSNANCESAERCLKFEDVLCPICHEIFIEPVSLPCKHNMCLQCLEKTVENNRLVCPICRMRIGTYIRLAKNLRKIINEKFWQNLKNQFPTEIQKKMSGEEDGIANKILSQQKLPTVVTRKGIIKEEFDEMFYKLKIEEENSRRAALIASEDLAKKIMEEELEEEKIRKKKTAEIAKSDVLYIKSLILAENAQKHYSPSASSQSSENNASSCSSSYGRDSISDELRHFTPICIAPTTPPKRLPNGKLDSTRIIKPINLTTSFNGKQQGIPISSVANKTPLKISSNNFLRTKPSSSSECSFIQNNEESEEEEEEEENMEIDKETTDCSCNINLNLTEAIPLEIIKEQEMIQKRIKQEQQDKAIALKLQSKWNKEKTVIKRQHGYQLRSTKRSKRVKH